MSDRIATKAAKCRNLMEEIHDDLDRDEAREVVKDAAKKIKQIEQYDRDLNGPTPENKLVAYLDDDTCPNCGDEVGEAGWCSWECMQEDAERMKAEADEGGDSGAD